MRRGKLVLGASVVLASTPAQLADLTRLSIDELANVRLTVVSRRRLRGARRPDRRPRTLTRLLAALAATCLLEGGARAADEVRPSEYEVKAAFLFHFARLTEWPSSALPEGQPFVVAIVGRDPFGPALDRVLENQTAHGRPLEVHRAASLGELPRPAHIVFVGGSERSEVGRMLRRFERRPVLTVGQRDGFCEAGGVVNFLVTAEGRVRFEINVRAAEASGLRMSSQVLKLARIVGQPPR